MHEHLLFVFVFISLRFTTLSELSIEKILYHIFHRLVIKQLQSTMKSTSNPISKYFISGLAVTTLGLPPYLISLAYGSPNVLVTDSLPGNTL